MFKVLHNIPLSDKQKGMLCAFIGYTGFAFADACSKWLSADYSVYQVSGTNYFLACILLLVLSPFIGGVKSLNDPQTLRLQAFRGVLNFLCSLIVIYSLSILPMATVYTMIFAMPFFSVLIAVPLYKETLRADRLMLLVLGFAGVVIAFQPWLNGFDIKLVLPLLSSFIIALMFTTARSLKPETSIFALGFTPILVAFLITLPFAIPTLQVPAPADLPVIILDGVCVCIGVVFVSQSFRMVAASIAAPFVYSEMIWALLFGFIIFSDTPDIPMMVGAAIIIACGFYIVRHER